MDREESTQLAHELAQALVDHAYITEANKSKVAVVIALELNKKYVAPLEAMMAKMVNKLY